MEVAPTVHYQMGGVRADPETAQTSVEGLYAAGEVACGLHGANRLGGNSLSDILVFGRRAGIASGEYVSGVQPADVSEEELRNEIARVLAPFTISNGTNPFELKERIASTMWRYVGIMRNEQDLRRGLEEIRWIKQDAKRIQAKGGRVYNQSWVESLEVGNMAFEFEAIISSAIERKESRGAHTRSDYPKKDDSKELVNIITKLKDGQMVHEMVPVPKLPKELQALIKE
jgi:succinate dehydrogenase / fumarate reductase flavoprotein subunit